MPERFSLRWIVEKEDTGKLLREFLVKKKVSKTALTDIKFKGGKIQVNNEEVNVRYILKLNDEIIVSFPPEQASEQLKGERIPIEIVYEDDYLLVVNKPAGMSTIPSREHPQGSLANAIVAHYEQSGHGATVHIVTRLDRDTSGLVLIAKHRHIHHLFSLDQRQNKVKRTYTALVEGDLFPLEGQIIAPIGRMDTSIIQREVRADGQYACTNYKVIRTFQGFSVVELRLLTGRTHQIRVHMSYMGHPLLGDDLYGGPVNELTRQALHCTSLSIKHPVTEECMSFKSSLPVDMSTILKRLL